MVLGRNMEPYVDKTKDLELLLQFHDQVLRQQCEVLEALQESVFFSKEVDFKSFYQVWDYTKRPLSETDEGSEKDKEQVAKAKEN